MSRSVDSLARRPAGGSRRGMFRNPLIDSVVALLVLLVVFGPKRLPALGRSLGQGINDFRHSIRGRSSDANDGPALIPAQTSAGAAAPVTQGQASSEQ